MTQKLTFSKKEIKAWEEYVERFTDEGAEAEGLTVFEGSRVQQIYLAKLAVLRGQIKIENPHNIPVEEGQVHGFGDIGKHYTPAEHAE